MRGSWSASEKTLITTDKDEWPISEGSNWDDESSIACTYVAVDSTNMTMSGLHGPGRLLGNLYSFLGGNLEHRVLEASARRCGADPAQVGARIRGMSVWAALGSDSERPAAAVVPLNKRCVLALRELKSEDSKVLRRCCRAILFYMSTGVLETIVSGLREIIDLSAKYFAVRDAFVAVKAPDFLRILPLLVKQEFASPTTETFRVLKPLLKKAQVCLTENAVYAACRKSFSSPSWSPGLEGIELRLTLESFLDHEQLSFLAAGLIIFYGLEQRSTGPRKILYFVQSLPFWTEHKHRKYAIGIDILAENDKEILERCCRNLLLCLNVPESSFKISALEAIASLSRRYRAVRETFINIGTVKILQRINVELVQDARDATEQLKEIQNHATTALFSIGENEIYDLLKDSTLRKSWSPEVDGVVLRLELEQYLYHAKLKAIASVYMSFSELTGCTFHAFESHARHLLNPSRNDFGPSDKDKNDLTLSRVCFVLVKFATGSNSLRTRIQACKYLENIIFSQPSSRAVLNELDLSGKFVRATGPEFEWLKCEAKPNDIRRYLTLSKRITTCLQDHEVFPKGIAYFQELNETLLELIFDYLRSPELFVIGAKVLAKTWLKVIYLNEDMFLRVVAFVTESLEEMAKYDEAELLVVSILEKILFEQRITPQSTIYYPAKCRKLVDAICSPKFLGVYSIAYSRIQEYREQISALPRP